MKKPFPDGVIIEKDVAITLRDVVTVYADIFRPEGEDKAAPLIAWGYYG